MSFSSKVKKELAEHVNNAVHCRIAELAALISMCGSVMIDENNHYAIRVRTETEPTANKEKDLIGDVDAQYCQVMNYKAEDFVPVMACPSNVDHIEPVSDLIGKEIDQVFIGSCTNGR